MAVGCSTATPTHTVTYDELGAEPSRAEPKQIKKKVGTQKKKSQNHVKAWGGVGEEMQMKPVIGF